MATTSPSDSSDLLAETLQNRGVRLQALADEYREDPEMQSRAESDPVGLLAEKGMNVPPGTDVRVVVNTPETFHLVLPPDPNMPLMDEDLMIVAGGKGGGNCVSSASTIPSCAGTASTAQSVEVVGG